MVSNFIVQALRAEDITIYGEGQQTRSFCYVDDLVSGLIGFMEQEQTSGPLNLGNPVETTMLQLAETVLRLTGSSSKLVFQPLPLDDPRQRCPDVSKAVALLAWEPKICLEDGLKETIAYFRGRLA